MKRGDIGGSGIMSCWKNFRSELWGGAIALMLFHSSSLNDLVQPARESKSDCIAYSSIGWQGLTQQQISAQSPTWIMIPDWLAGVWQAQSQVILNAYDYTNNRKLEAPVSVRIDKTSVVGMQQDHLGRVWHFAGTPYIKRIDAGAYIECQNIYSLQLEQSSQKEVVVRSKSNVTHLDKQTSDTTAAFREETVTTYTPIQDGLIKVNFTISDFDLTGKQIFSSEKMELETRTKKFQRVDNDPDRGDLKASFRQFLNENGMQDLSPDFKIKLFPNR